MPLFPPAEYPRLIVKVGSALLVEPDGKVRRAWLGGLAEQLAQRRAEGQQLVVVSSGAIALGARRLGLAKGGRASLEDAQAAAATGQIELSRVWAELLGTQGLTAAQMLVTLDDLEDRRRYLNASATLDRLLGLGVVPVVNENDSVATAEIRFGDNDRLAARVAQAAGATGVVLLSDVDGLYTADPHRDTQARLIPRIGDIDSVAGLAGGSSASGMGSGGMRSKLEAARIASAAGIPLAIASGRAAALGFAAKGLAGGTADRARANRGGRRRRPRAPFRRQPARRGRAPCRWRVPPRRSGRDRAWGAGHRARPRRI
jgi:glutamate 5-kinase